MKKYDLILADPPWQYNNKVSNGAADNHYNTTDLYSISRLPIEKHSSKNSVLFMWYTGNFALEAIKLAEAWDFKVKNMFGFAWVKLNKNAGDRINKKPPEDFFDFMEILNNETKINCGNYTRQNVEIENCRKSYMVTLRNKRQRL
ncbi:MT-A70 family methyltransferase [Proteus terrae]|uniref:MT-A70 family methyltransferase n=1 Tax=Proteus terrae TaxID=1574161 RepID=UPI000D694797|nr:MT-A70 family methyltransferase [Proteus terrae]